MARQRKPEAEARPFLDCPSCGRDLIEAKGRGREDASGNQISHRDKCRCRWCDWWWSESAARFTCECGAVAKVYCDDGTAFAVLDAAGGRGE